MMMFASMIVAGGEKVHDMVLMTYLFHWHSRADLSPKTWVVSGLLLPPLEKLGQMLGEFKEISASRQFNVYNIAGELKEISSFPSQYLNIFCYVLVS